MAATPFVSWVEVVSVGQTYRWIRVFGPTVWVEHTRDSLQEAAPLRKCSRCERRCLRDEGRKVWRRGRLGWSVFTREGRGTNLMVLVLVRTMNFVKRMGPTSIKSFLLETAEHTAGLYLFLEAAFTMASNFLRHCSISLHTVPRRPGPTKCQMRPCSEICCQLLYYYSFLVVHSVCVGLLDCY